MKGSTNASAKPNIRLMDQTVTFSANPDDETNLAFPYRASVEDDRITQYMCATVIFSPVQASSGDYATFCQTYDGGVYIYARTDVGEQTIPAISCDISVNYVNMDDTPTDGSNVPITSDGVFNALLGKINGTGNIGNDTNPVKVVNGVATPVQYPFARGDITGEQITVDGCVLNKVRIGNVLFISLQDATPTATGDFEIIDNAVEGTQYGLVPIMSGLGGIVGYLYGQYGGHVIMRINQVTAYTGFHANYLIQL